MINTRNRRASMMNFASGDDLLMPNPDGLFDTPEDRLQLLGLYSGVAAEPPHATILPALISTFGGYTSGQAATNTFSVTITDSAQKLIVMAWHYDFSVSLDSVTFNGDPFSVVDSANQTYLCVLGAPDVGTHDLVVTLNRSRWQGAVAWVVENWEGDFRQWPGTLSVNDYLQQVTSSAVTPSLTFPSGPDDLTLQVIRNSFPLDAGFAFTANFGQAVGTNQSPSPGNALIGEATSKSGDTSVTVGFSVAPAVGTFLTAFSLLAPDAPEETPYLPVGINPQRGDPVGDIHFIRVNIGVEKYFAAETTIRDAQEPWGGKKGATLLRIGASERALSREGYQATTCTFTVSDTPHPITGDRLWRGLMEGGSVNSRTIEGALIELYRCQAPHGQILGTPFRLWAGVVKPGGFKASSGFRFEFSCVDLLGDRFANPRNQPNIPTFRLNTTIIPNLVADANGKYVPRVMGNSVEDGVGVVPMLPVVQNVNLFDLLGGLALNVNVDVWLLSEGAVYDIPRGYYNPPVWGSDAEVLAGDLIRPTPENRNGHVFRAENDGTTGGSEPTWPTSGTVNDNGITWHEDGSDDPQARYPIPDEAYSTFLTHPFAPNWTSVTGRTEQYIDYPFTSGTRRLIPVFTLHDHRYGDALRDGRITLLFNVIGARSSPDSGPPLTTFTSLYIRLLLDYLFTPTDLTTYGDIPIYGALDGPYSVIDTESADEAEAVGDALGGLMAGFVLAPAGEQQSMWTTLSKILRGGSLEIGPNRHGQLTFHRRDPEAAATITFRATTIRDSSYTADGTRRATTIQYRYGPRYADPFASVATPAQGDPLPVSKEDWGWQSGLQQLTNEDAFDALWNTHAALLPDLSFDNEITRDSETANTVARRELDYATGPGPAYHGTTLFELTGSIDDLLLRLDSNGRTRELGHVFAIADDEGPTADGATTLRHRITRIRLDPEANLCTFWGDVLPEVA